ncbi:MAG: hypothetical protein IJO76_00745 [Clostridia bacterium]|nr:hypothetical protein [Clostridia bacterium]
MKVSALFSDHMVLQRQKPIRVWGEGGGIVTVHIGDATASALCEGGKFLVELPPMEAGGPYTMTVTDAFGEVTLTDVMIGEVWLAAGQSNMEHPLFSAEDGFEAAAAADLPNIRFFTVARRSEAGQDRYNWHFEAVRSVDTPWQVCTPDTALRFSAIGFYFARHLQAEEGVAVGVISCNFGGTRIEPWIAKETVETDPRLAMARERARKALESLNMDEYNAVYDAYRDELDAQCLSADAVAKARELGPYAFGRYNCIDWPKEPPFGPRWQNWPGNLYEHMTATIVPYALRGVLWYQGESSRGDAPYYFDMFEAYAEQCRRDFRDEHLPIFTVQLAPYICDPPFSWARIVEAQVRIAKEQEDVYLITSGDIGEYGNIHPMYKRQFGDRLWLAASRVLYGGDAEYCGPIYASHCVVGNTVRVAFTHATALSLGENPDFMLCGEDGVFYPATATVEGATLVLTSEQVPSPVHARYGFADQFRLSLFNGEGLPAAPFRTDFFEE